MVDGASPTPSPTPTATPQPRRPRHEARRSRSGRARDRAPPASPHRAAAAPAAAAEPPTPVGRRGTGGGTALAPPRSCCRCSCSPCVAGWFLSVDLPAVRTAAAAASVVVTIPRARRRARSATCSRADGVSLGVLLRAARHAVGRRRRPASPGTFTLEQDMSYARRARRADARHPPPPTVINVTIPRARAAAEIAAAAARQDGLRGRYLAATRSVDRAQPAPLRRARRRATLEGFLFPATYQLQAAARRSAARRASSSSRSSSSSRQVEPALRAQQEPDASTTC